MTTQPSHLPPWRHVLAVVAHPDDESFALGAVIAALADSGSRCRPLDRRQVEQPEEESREAEEDEYGPAQRPRGAADPLAARLLGVVHGVSREAAFARSLPFGAGPGLPLIHISEPTRPY